jgi:hypothetical protein
MNCPHCHLRIETEAEKTKARRVQAKLCVECGAPALGYFRCFACRRKIADRKRKGHSTT